MTRGTGWRVALLLGGLSVATVRAETTECSVITSVPTTLVLQGVYCLKGNLATAMADGIAIIVATNNVTIDFNGYKLGGQSAGPGTDAIGVGAFGRLNVQLRNGTIRGFRKGILLEGGAGHVVEGMTLDANTEVGVKLSDAHRSLVRGNQIWNTGGPALFFGNVYGIYVDGVGNRLLDNDVANTLLDGSRTPHAYGIRLSSVVEANRVTDSGTFGIHLLSGGDHVAIVGNHVHNGSLASHGVLASYQPSNICRDNLVSGFNTPVDCSVDGGGNVSAP